MKPKRTPPRLFVIFARAADEAVVFRRGPSAWFHLVRWNTRDDTFESGAWIRGRIYPEKCDLSPDGRLLVYSVHSGRRAGTTFTDCWTGVSRSPWLDALALWPIGTTYGGGGRFEDDRMLILRFGECSAPHPDHLPPRRLSVRYGNPPLHASEEGVAGAQWVGRDQRGRRVFARDGKLFARRADARDDVLADFNGLVPEPRPAPAWARRESGR